ncbi:hypothetical protein [Sulfurimonas sp.]|uniref:hypothetical protein n=1 Tax=Sulfurimonas sp. TaxID=2022749 RepID=UPI003561ED98
MQIALKRKEKYISQNKEFKYQAYLDVLAKVKQDFIKYGDKVPFTSDEWDDSLVYHREQKKEVKNYYLIIGNKELEKKEKNKESLLKLLN